MTAPASKLLQPITVGPLELKNRIMFPPLTTGYEERDGSIGERSLAFYERLARGGVSYIVIGDVAPVMTASPTPKLATDEELLRLVEMQDTDRPAQTPFLISRTDSDSSVVFRVEFRSASGWLLYGAKEYEASFNDDGGHLVSTMWLSTYDTPQLSAQATDPEALMSLVINMEVGMLGEHGFNFSDPSEFTSDELYTAYLLLAAEEELQARYNEAEQKYFISTRHITAVLDRYFKDYSFDITQCSQYDATFDGIVTSTVSGFGGNRFMKILNVSPKEGTFEVRFDADFYADETEKDVTMQKSYTIEFYDDGYYYLSAMEFVVN